MYKNSLRNLLIIPLIASSILLASPVLASNSNEVQKEVSSNHHKRNSQRVIGKVSAINGDLISVIGKNGEVFTVYATNATIMKASDDPKINPMVINISDIKIGDTLFARGSRNEASLVADNIFDGPIMQKHDKKMHRMMKYFKNQNS